MLPSSTKDASFILATENANKWVNYFSEEKIDVITVGDKITLKSTNYSGIVRFIGSIDSKKGIFYGIDLDNPNGKNDGSYNNIYYFKTKPNHGIFMKKTKLINTNSYDMHSKNKDMFRVTVGDKVFVHKFKCNAIIKFIGTTLFKSGIWYGLELKQKKGKNNGTINGHTYFKCKNKYGSFMTSKGISNINKHKKINPSELIESLLQMTNNKRKMTSKAIEWLSKDNITEILLSYLSRMKQPHINNDFKINFNTPLSEPMIPYSDNISEIYSTKLSHSLMLLLCNQFGDDLMNKYIFNKCSQICLHALSVFHPASNGNVYHARVILQSLLAFPIKFITILIDKNNTQIQCLFKCALFRNLHQGNLNEFLNDLLSFQLLYTEREEIIKILKIKLIKILVDWKFIEYILSIACDSKYDNDDHIATEYATVFMNLIQIICPLQDAYNLFKGKENLIIDCFMRSILDRHGKRSKIHRTNCVLILIQYIDLLSREIVTIEDGIDIFGTQSPNCMHSMFNCSLNRLQLYITEISDVIINNIKLKPIHLSCGIIKQPFGQIRYHCFELLLVLIEYNGLKCGEILKKINYSFFESLLGLIFIHHSNNVFLNVFCKLIQLIMIFRRRILKYLFVKHRMLGRFIDFYKHLKPNWQLICHGFIRIHMKMFNIHIPFEIYNFISNYYPKYYENGNTPPRTELHGYILYLLWNVYNNDKNEEENMFTTVNCMFNYNVVMNNSISLANNKISPNMSDEHEDQWDIISYFNNYYYWKEFYEIILSEIKTQRNPDFYTLNPKNQKDTQNLDGLLLPCLGTRSSTEWILHG